MYAVNRTPKFAEDNECSYVNVTVAGNRSTKEESQTTTRGTLHQESNENIDLTVTGNSDIIYQGLDTTPYESLHTTEQYVTGALAGNINIYEKLQATKRNTMLPEHYETLAHATTHGNGRDVSASSGVV